MNTHTPVLIVGAGPTGLMMACELQRHGIPFRIIDKKLEQTQGSNATWIQTRTLEIFDLIGMAEQFLRLGHRCEAINFYLKGKALANIPLNNIDSSFPFILMLPQRETERLLIKKLAESKIQVERGLELTDIQQSPESITTTVRLPNGNTEKIISDWLIACDGANSIVREKCQISFPGEDISEQFMVADARMSSFLPTNEIHVFFDKGTIFPDKGTIFSAFPWGSSDYRLSANLYLSHPRQTFTKQEVIEIVAERTYGNFIVENVSWISPFWIHSKIANQVRQGVIFLAGDAADIQSPAGGQGMNTGIQDAFNLAWKLALVIKGKAKKELLESYQSERFPIIKDTVKRTEYFTKMIVFDKSFVSKLRKFSQQISAKKTLSKKICTELTQLKIQYKKSPIINYDVKPEKQPRQGERAPDVILKKSEKLYDYLRGTQHNILVFTGNNPTKKVLENMKELHKTLNKKYPDLIKITVITDKNLNEFDHVIHDETNAIHKRYHVKKPSVYIIRPDNYIAYYSNKINSLSLQRFLKKYLR